MEEQWRDVPGYEDHYQISDSGKIKSVKYRKEKILKQTLIKGYYGLGLCLEGKRKVLFIHVMIAMAFLDHVPNGHVITVDHINGNKTDNRLENIQLLTNRENVSKSTPSYKKSSLPVGVCKFRNKYISSIKENGSKVYLGLFPTPEEAAKAYGEALAKIVGN